MHDVNWCENCGTIISRVRIRTATGENGRAEFFDDLVCDCLGRPKPAFRYQEYGRLS